MPDKTFKWVRSIYGKDGPEATAKERYGHISDGGINDLIKSWHDKQPDRDWLVASPSRLLTCPRVVWLHNQGVKPTNPMTWAVKQRLLLGRLAEGIFAKQFKDEGILLHHWDDNPGEKQDPFMLGEGLDRLKGTPDFLLHLPPKQATPEQAREMKNAKPGETIQGDLPKSITHRVAVSDAKTGRSDGYGYVPLGAPEIWNEWNWYRMKIQLTAYYMLCRAQEKLKVILPEAKWSAGVPVERTLPYPEVCHLFSYALDDGVVRREETWEPTEEDMETVRKMTRRFNEAVVAKECPKCTCAGSYDGFDVKFCDFSVPIPGQKVAEVCCQDDLIPKEVKL